MKNKLNIAEQLKQKYHKCEEVRDFKEMIERSAQIYKTRTAFKLKNKDGEIYSKTYEEVKNDIYALGTELIENGLTNKRIAVIGKNSYKWAISYLASSIVGVVVPIDKELHSDDVINFMNVAECECVLGDGKNLKTITENIEKLNNKKTIFVDFEKSFEHYLEAGRTLLEKGNTKFEEIKINPDEMKILLFTSGTTGNAKGVCLSQKNICSNILSIYGIVKVKRSDLFFSILPLHHTYECTIGFLLPLYSGASICYCDGLRYISKNMLEYHPSVILCVPLLLESMYKKIMKSLKKSLPEKYTKDGENPIDKLPFILRKIVSRKVKNTLGGRLRVFIVGAAAVNPEIANTFDKLKLNSLQGYGLTECAPLVAGNTDFFKRNDSAGLPIPTVEYKIDNPNQEGVGEIIVKGPNIMLGYYNMPEETEKVLKDGWFHTGDLGKIDENGFLYITGRCKSVIVTKNGKNIYPEEIEMLLEKLDEIKEVMVYGKEPENNSRKEAEELIITARVIPDKEKIKELYGDISDQEIYDIIWKKIKEENKKLNSYKAVKALEIKDGEFEKTSTMKIKRYKELKK